MAFKIVHTLFYVLAQLPFRVLYIISDILSLAMYHFFPYRKKMILKNLSIAFPSKLDKEKNIILKKFYKQFVDGFLEMLKMYGSDPKIILNRCSGNIEVIENLVKNGHTNIQMHSGHQFNWEYANWFISKNTSQQVIGVYTQISNKVLNEIFLKLREKIGTKMIVAQEFNKNKEQILSSPYLLGQIADQKPATPLSGYWLNFFNNPTVFISGPDKGARAKGATVIFSYFEQIKRGYYNYYFEVFTTNASTLKEGELTLAYARFLEKAITKNPVNYLWSHNRWKWEWKNEYHWIDDIDKKPQ